MSRSYVRLIVHPIRSFKTALKVFRPHVWILSGDEISSGQKLSIIYAGNETNRNFISHLAFGDSCRTEYIGKKWLWKISKVIRQNSHNCSLTVAEVPDCLRILSERTKCFYVPGWVSSAIDTSSYTKRDSVKTDKRRIQKHRLLFEVTGESSQLHNFYHNMYKPWIKKVHGNKAIIMSYDYVREQFEKRGTLLLVTKDQEYVGGISLLCDKSRARLWSLGVADSYSGRFRDGVPGVLYYFAVNYLKARGYNTIECGRSRAFLRDGVLEFKKKRGGRIIKTSKMGFLIRAISRTDGVEGFFLNNPFIHEDRAGLKGVIFVANDRSLSRSDFARIHKQYYHRGLSRLVIYRFGNSENDTGSAVPPEFSDCMTVCSAESKF